METYRNKSGSSDNKTKPNKTNKCKQIERIVCAWARQCYAHKHTTNFRCSHHSRLLGVRSVTEYTGLCNKQMRVANSKWRTKQTIDSKPRERKNERVSKRMRTRENEEAEKREIISCIGILCAIYSFAFRNFHRKITWFFAQRTGDLKFHSNIFWKCLQQPRRTDLFSGSRKTLYTIMYIQIYILLCFRRLFTTRTRSGYFFALLLLWFHLFSPSHCVSCVFVSSA